MTYSVKEIFLTLQGEGAHTGRRAVFCRFTGCNLWNGREQDRADAICQFCDTDFVGTDGHQGGKYAAAPELAQKISQTWGSSLDNRYVVLTGGEPLLQVDTALINALHAAQFTIAIETNGTIEVPDGIDWVCVSPKANAQTLVTKGNELKLVYPQENSAPESYETWSFDHFFLQPMDNAQHKQNIDAAINYCLAHPKWRLSLQTHKLTGLP
jgi:7-carboxy-7-deazaguanine synthase (Cx14CxxC type)